MKTIKELEKEVESKGTPLGSLFYTAIDIKNQTLEIIKLIEDEFTDERLENYSDSDLKALRTELIKKLKGVK